MPILEIDGIGRVEVGKEFLSLPPDRQAAEVDAIAASIRPPAPASAPLVPGGAPAVAPAAPVQAQAAAASPEPPGAVGRVAGRAAEVAKDRFGDRPLGLSDQTLSELVERGVIAPEGGTATPIQLLNQITYQYGAKAGDLALRTIAAAIGGIQGAAGQTAEELGASPGMARRLERDVGMGIESAGVVAGTPTAPRIPRAAAGTAEAAVPEGATAVAIKSPAGAGEFKTASQGFYKQFEEAGVVVKPQSYSALADDVFATAAKNRLNQTLTPGSMEAVKQIRELADPRVGPITFETLDTMRALAGDARQTAKVGSNDARVAGLIIDKIDDYIANIKAGDVLAGDAQAAAKAIPVARELWSRARNLETITDMIDRAKTSAGQFSGSGFENALRTEFRSLAKSKERMKSFDETAQKAIKLVARGTTGGNVARFVGKLAPTGVVSGALGGGIGAAAGSAIGIGPVAGAIAAGSLGFAGRNIATALTQRSIRRLEDIIRQGGDTKFARTSLDRAAALLGNLERAGTATIPAPATRNQEKR